ncbi:MAG TPA: hypothetical protein VHI71_03360 [Actinomycetota bacterium]|nr:hypothetical protein [Actinomycetota bacterium]
MIVEVSLERFAWRGVQRLPERTLDDGPEDAAREFKRLRPAEARVGGAGAATLLARLRLSALLLSLLSLDSGVGESCA